VTETATFGAGCFWGVEIAFRNVPGVTDTAVGYEGGTLPNPTYEEVSYDELLDVFWDVHDPTQVNRQGPDVGSNYRSAIFFHSPEQRERALESKARVQTRFDRPIATEITPASDFWPAEEYHQQYLVKRGLATCRI
jgi:peptide-methionine (S)-S-oxide reductase